MDMKSIVSSLGLNEATCENNTSLVILLSVVTSNLRNVRVSGVGGGGEWCDGGGVSGGGSGR